VTGRRRREHGGERKASVVSSRTGEAPAWAQLWWIGVLLFVAGLMTWASTSYPPNFRGADLALRVAQDIDRPGAAPPIVGSGGATMASNAGKKKTAGAGSGCGVGAERLTGRGLLVIVIKFQHGHILRTSKFERWGQEISL